MHDWTLISVTFEWQTGKVSLLFQDENSQIVKVTTADSVDLRISKNEEWGPSISVNEVSGPSLLADGNYRLRIEMQSGDTIQIDAGTISLPPKA